MNLILLPSTFNIENINLLRKKENTIVDGNFSKFTYATDTFIMNGIYLFFPVKSMIFLGVLYLLSIYYFIQKKSTLRVFFYFSLLGMLVYIIGLYLKVELVLSSQWMKVNIWLKFFAIIGVLGLCQQWFEKRYIRLLTLILFLGALLIALLRFDPVWDKEPPSNLYTWITINTEEGDLFLVPPELVDFKARTWRSSYFDFKAMLHHRPAIYEWAERFELIFGAKIGKRKPSDDIFGLVRNSYFSIGALEQIPEVDYIIVSESQLTEKRLIALARSWDLVYESDSYALYRQRE